MFKTVFVIIFALVLQLFSQPAFQQLNGGFIKLLYSSADWGDFDKDSDLDIILTGMDGYSFYTRIYRNNGVGSFTDINAELTGIAWGSAKWGDYDNDGDLDILVTGGNQTDLVTKIYRNNGNSTFTDINAGLIGISNGIAKWGDYNNDCFLDVLITGMSSSGSKSEIYKNNGDETFTNINAGLIGLCYSTASWVDFDNDGDLDVFLAGVKTSFSEGYSKIYRNDSGSFTDIAADLTGVANGSAAWGDYDSDGDPDLLLSGSGVTKIYRNNFGTFTDIVAGLKGVINGSVAWGDYDSDGDLDIILSGYSNPDLVSYLYRNDSNNVFTLIDSGIQGVSFGSVVWGDYDNDNDLDLFVIGSLDDGSSGGETVFSDIYTNITSGIEDSSVPFTTNLYHNYPNPFNPDTKISFSIPGTQDVKLSVYNSNGQLVKELANGKFNSGNHSVDFNGADLNSGIYFYRMETGDKKLTRKMLLIK